MNHILIQLKIILSKFRLSSHDLEIERGKYGHKSTNMEECYGKFCESNSDLMTEDVFHFLWYVHYINQKERKCFKTYMKFSQILCKIV